MRYLLDTNVVIALLNKSSLDLIRRLRRHQPSDIGVSSVVLHELYFGAFKSRCAENNLALVDNLRFEVLEFGPHDAREAGRVRAQLSAKGTPIGPYDALIAGQAKARSLILVTHNINEFERVPGLRIQNWQ